MINSLPKFVVPKGMNKFLIAIYTEAGCSVDDGEYNIMIGQIISGIVESGDFELIEECIAENLDKLQLPSEGITPVFVAETGEWEGLMWNKYYEIENEK